MANDLAFKINWGKFWKFVAMQIDLSVRAGGLNMGWVYTSSDKIQVGVFWVQVKYGSGVFRFYRFWINPTGLERLFFGYLFFCQNKKISIFIT